MPQFSTTKYKFPVVKQAQSDAQFDLDNEGILNVTLNPNTFLKQVTTFNLLSKKIIRDMNSGTNPDNAPYNPDFATDVIFNGLPESSIGMARIVPLFYSESGNDPSTFEFFGEFYYNWELKGTESYILHLHYSGDISSNLDNVFELPLYLDVNIHFLNDFVFEVK